MRNRIRITLTALALVLAVNGLQAQTAKVEYAYDGMYQFIPKSMTADGKVRLVTKSADGSNGTAQVHITVYDSDFEQEKIISNNARITSTGNTRTRKATRATISECDSTDITSDIERVVSPDNMDGNVTVDDYKSYCKYYGDNVNMTEDGLYYSDYGYNYGYEFYGYEVFGYRYPYVFVTFEGGKAYRIKVMKYTPEFTDSQWTNDSWTYYESANGLIRSFVLHDLDEDKGYNKSDQLIVTQSLFNDDSKYEYIRTLRKAGVAESGELNTSTSTSSEESPTQTETLDKTVYGVCGYEVVSEDGSVVFTIEIDDEDVTYYTEGSDSENIMVVKMNGELYFIVTTKSYSSSKSNKMLVYKLDKTTNSVKKVKTSNDIRILPRIVNNPQPVSITFKEAVNTDVNVVVTALDGKIVTKRNVRAGETSVDISTAGLATGLYNFTVLSKGRVVENGKVIVK